VSVKPIFRAEAMAAIAAVRAGLAIVQRRQDAEHVRLKGPRDLVTGTDLAAQAAIERVLREHDPEIAFVGEEDAEDDEGEEGADREKSVEDAKGDEGEKRAGERALPRQGRYWLVDPLCGTNNFAAEVPFFAINVALVDDGRVMLGVVADGSTGEIHVAERGKGAFLLNGGDRSPLRVNPRASLVSVDPMLPGPGWLRRFDGEVATRVIAEARHSVLILGSTLALVYLARGRLAAAVYACTGLPVHFAAGLLIAEEAGAIVTDEQGNPWQLLGPIYIASANSQVHEELRGIAQSTVHALTTG
jgi:myo-inositol-1(or 4)-monophosphatase